MDWLFKFGGSQSIRLVLSYEDGNFRVISAQRLKMRTLPSAPFSKGQDQPGFGYELRDAQDRPLYFRNWPSSMQFYREVLTEDPQYPLAWRKKIAAPETFVILIPDLDQGRSLVIFGSPPGLLSLSQPAQQLARFDLREVFSTKE